MNQTPSVCATNHIETGQSIQSEMPKNVELGTISESQYLLNTEQILYVYECPGISESFHSSTAFEEMRRKQKILKDKTNITIAAMLWTTKWSAVLSKNSS